MADQVKTTFQNATITIRFKDPAAAAVYEQLCAVLKTAAFEGWLTYSTDTFTVEPRIADPAYQQRLIELTDYFRRSDTSSYPPIVVGHAYVFAYPDFGQPSSQPDYDAHRFYVVTVLKQLQVADAESEQQAMYEVRADDGWQGEAFDSELYPLQLEAL